MDKHTQSQARCTATVAALLILVSLTTAFAQTATTVTAKALGWKYLGATVADIATYTQTVVVNGTTVPTAPTCIAAPGSPADVYCEVPVANFTAANNTVSVTATKGMVSSQLITNGLTLGAVVKDPSSQTVTIKTTVTIQ